jgi:hypothetical protein
LRVVDPGREGRGDGGPVDLGFPFHAQALGRRPAGGPARLS